MSDRCCEGVRPLKFSRRYFLKQGGIAMVGLSAMPAFLQRAIAATPTTTGKKQFVVLFQRGAADGLNIVVPFAEPNYYRLRPSIAIPQPRRGVVGEAAIDLDGYFGLHPSLALLELLFHKNQLALVHAAGSPDPTRSHFDAQDFMESGTPGIKSTQDGWLNRTLAAIPGTHSPTEALSLGPPVPRILSGKVAVANIALGRAAERPMPMDRPVIEAAFDKMYVGNDSISRAYRDGRQARMRLVSELTQDMTEANAGAPSPNGFSDDTDRLARLIGRDPTIRVAFMALGGWDTHVSEGAANGQLAGHLKPLGEGLASLAKQLGPSYQDTVIMVISEFGRTMHENGNGGTDHGHGNVMWVMGGPVKGRKVYGKWPGLAT